jgi:polysaccharide lyase family 4-like protein
MKRALVCSAALFLAACDKSEPPKKPAAEAPKAVEYFHVDPATAGSVSGTIVFKGTRSPRQPISMEADEGCQRLHAGKPAYDEPVVTGKTGGLANAFVYIQAGLEGKKFEPAKDPVLIDQKGCAFLPRVIGVRAAQALALRNSDPVSHNIHPVPNNNREWNEQQSPGTPDVEHRFARTEVMIPVKCNVHSWMHAWIGVVDHPYFAVTGPDGAFSWKDVPPGDYTIAAWHQELREQKQQVHVAPSGAATVSITYQ